MGLELFILGLILFELVRSLGLLLVGVVVSELFILCGDIRYPGLPALIRGLKSGVAVPNRGV